MLQQQTIEIGNLQTQAVTKEKQILDMAKKISQCAHARAARRRVAGWGG